MLAAGMAHAKRAAIPAWDTCRADSEGEARRLLERACDAVGGRSAWLELPPVAASLIQEWSALAESWRPPMPEADARFTVHFEQDKARVDFSDPAGTCWAHDSREGWSGARGRRTYTHAAQAHLMVPTFKWFAAMPHKLLDPSAEHRLWRAPDRNRGGQVLVRFGTDNGQTGDQMLATLSPTDQRILRLTFTARELDAQVVGSAHFERWQPVGGLTLPSKVTVDLNAPVEVAEAQQLRFEGWRTIRVPDDFFEKPQQ